MYGIYDERIMELRKAIIKLDDERTELIMSIKTMEFTYGMILVNLMATKNLYGGGLAIVKRYNELKEELYINKKAREYAENEIDRLKAAWRDSRPRDGYFPMDDYDLFSKIREDGFINGRMI
jgi:hypothetical protein